MIERRSKLMVKLEATDPATKKIMIGILRKIRNYGGVAKFIENCDNKHEVSLVRKYKSVFGEWDKRSIAFQKDSNKSDAI